MQPRSASLFHFTRSLDILKSVLKDGFWPRYCLEDVEWQGREENDFIAFPMVCFCDIPMSRISEHVNFYGNFGIGLTKEWGAKNNLNPVFYFSGDNPLHGALKSLTTTVSNLEEPQNEKGFIDIRYILAHSKPTKGRMIIAGEPVTKDFYQESEWRYVPQKEGIRDYLRLKSFNNKKTLEKLNLKSQKECMLKFLPSDVRYIFVPTDSEVPAIMNFIQTELDHFPSTDLKLLMSRVTSLESLALDT